MTSRRHRHGISSATESGVRSGSRRRARRRARRLLDWERHEGGTARQDQRPGHDSAGKHRPGTHAVRPEQRPGRNHVQRDRDR
jgi:hypothetical protein